MITQATLLFMGVLALLGTLGMFLNVDRATRTAMLLFGSVLWGLMGMSAFDVIVPVQGQSAPFATDSILPLVYIGIALSGVVGIMALLNLLKLFGEESGASSGGLMQ